MTIQEKILKNGEGKYNIIYKTIELFYSGMAGRDIVKNYTISYKDGNFTTSKPELLTLDTKATWKTHQYRVEVECVERYFDIKEYDNNNTQTQEFEVIIGVNEGYFHDNESNINISKLYQEIAEKIFKETKIYVSAVITENRVIYSAVWGCPADGEVVYSIRGTRNPQFVDSFEKYKEATEKIAKILASELNQTTFTLTWRDAELNYFKKNKNI